METQKAEIRIYVACLAAYNNGRLHGRWIDANQDAGAIRAEVATMLKASPIPSAEEWAIHDYDGFEGAPISEYEGIDSVAEKAAFIAEHGELGGKLIEHFGGELEYARCAIEDHYMGQYASFADFAREYTEESFTIPSALDGYIDFEAMGRDMTLCDVFAIELGFENLHLFWSC
ncbi:antirestriction protein [Maricaulis sp. W15]|uniref:antirestriction protein ArdA n=1 Tax=Maricaulis sp. W15 TaxID=1772333 RepID=UPI000949008E|nr:antirestriction protein ArdA [Maricaulis sp. W15]OLF77698.1 antirestriction protein [Maricaulis sp. W15]